MAYGTWRSPFPRQFGGGSTKRADDIYQTIVANLGTALFAGEETAHGAEIIAAARCLWIASRAIDRRILQSDPRLLTTMIERWEGILAIRGSEFETDAVRRSRIAARLMSQFEGTAAAISQTVSIAFSPWTTLIHYTSPTDAETYWPGGTTMAGRPWWSTVCRFVVEYVRPASASDLDVETRIASARAALDEIVPAWADWIYSETQGAGVNANLYGFYLDQPNLDRACLTP